MKTASYHVLALLLAGGSIAQALDGSTRTIILTGTSAPGLGGNFTLLSDPIVNGSGVLAFSGQSATGAGLYEMAGNAPLLTLQTIASGVGGNFSVRTFALNESGTVAYIGQDAANNPTLYTSTGGTIAAFGQTLTGLTGSVSNFSANIGLSDSGSVAFSATTATGSAEYVTFAGVIVATATTAQLAPGTGALFSSLTSPAVNSAGTTAFYEQNGAAYGLYTAFGSTITTLATTQQIAPELNANFTSFLSNIAINDSGSAAFLGLTGSTSKGIFARLGGTLTAIATTARQAPGLGANFTNFAEPAISNSGAVVFRGKAGSGFGIYVGTGGPALQAIALTGQLAPGLNSPFAIDPNTAPTAFSKPAINDLGVVAFLGATARGSGLYLGDGQQPLVTVAYTGQELSGSTVTGISFSGGSDRGGGSQLNNSGQLAYKATLANGTSSIQLFTPTLHLRSGLSGAWATRSGWNLGILPSVVHDVVIDPATALTLTGPMLPTTVKSLVVGSGAGLAELTLQSTGTLTTPGGASIGGSGRIGGSGKLVVGTAANPASLTLTSAGTIAPGTAVAAGAIGITGNVTLQGTAHLAFDLGGVTRKTGYDFFGVTGQLALGGATLDVALLNGFTPLLGNSFDLFDAGSITGTFGSGSIHLPTLSSNLSWNTAQLATAGIITVAGLSAMPTTYTLAATPSAALIHAGGSATISATITNTGSAGADTLAFTGLNVSASPAGGSVTGLATLVSAPLALGNSAPAGSATFSSAVGGTYTLTPSITATNATLGAAAASAGVTAATVAVFSGAAKWAAAGPAAWGSGAGANWTDTAAASVHAAPGTFADYAATDTAVFDGTSGGSIVTLDGASPSLAALSFSGGSYTIARGTGGTLILSGPATVTASAGSHTVTAPVQLDANATAAVAGTLNLGTVTGAGKTLTKTGAGTLILSGAQNYAVLNADGGTTRVTGSFTGGTAIVHVNATTRFEAPQTLAALSIGAGVELTFGSAGSAAFDEPSVKIDGLAVVPEPGAAGLLLIGALGLLTRRRR